MKLALATLACLFMFADSCIAANLVFSNSVEVRAGRIYLGDLAKIDNAASFDEQLRRFDLGNAPLAGRTERVSATQVVDLIRTRLPQIDRLNWSGAAEIILRTKAKIVPFEEVSGAAIRAAKSTLGVAEDFEAVRPTRYSDIAIPDLPYSIEVSRLNLTQDCKRLSSVAQIKSEGKVLASTIVWLSTQIQKQEEERTGKLEKSELPPHQAGIFEQPRQNKCVDWFARLSRYSSSSSGSARSAVARMEEVIVELKAGMLLIETHGIALGDARVSELVRIARSGSLETFSARVIGPGRVRISAGEDK